MSKNEKEKDKATAPASPTPKSASASGDAPIPAATSDNDAAELRRMVQEDIADALPDLNARLRSIGYPRPLPSLEEFETSGYAPENYVSRMQAYVAELEEQAKEKPPEPTGKRSTYHVVGPGTVRRDGRTLGAGEELEMTASEADELGDAVAPGPKPKAKRPPSGHGRYRVLGPGVLRFGARVYGPGQEEDVVALSATDVDELKGSVELERVA